MRYCAGGGGARRSSVLTNGSPCRRDLPGKEGSPFMKLEALLLFCLLLILLFPHAAQGQEDRNYGSWSLYWENDYLAKTDSNYTNGGRLSWTSPWISWKPEGN